MSTRGRVDDPNFTIIREAIIEGQSPAASLTDFCVFQTRNKCIVRSVSVHCQSLPSAATTFSVELVRNGASTVASYTQSSFSVVGDMSLTFTLVSSNTLASLGDSMSIRLDGTEKGKFNVKYEYQWLPPSVNYPEQK